MVQRKGIWPPVQEVRRNRKMPAMRNSLSFLLQGISSGRIILTGHPCLTAAVTARDTFRSSLTLGGKLEHSAGTQGTSAARSREPAFGRARAQSTGTPKPFANTWLAALGTDHPDTLSAGLCHFCRATPGAAPGHVSARRRLGHRQGRLVGVSPRAQRLQAPCCPWRFVSRLRSAEHAEDLGSR